MRRAREVTSGRRRGETLRRLMQAAHQPEMYEVTAGEGALGLELEVYDIPCPEMTVSAVKRGGQLEGRVRVGDILVRIDSTEVRHLSLEAVQRLCWQRRRHSKRLTFVHSHS